MALASATISFPSTSITTFEGHLKSSKRIVALLGAGLSASSGLATYRGVGADGLWNGHELTDLSSLKAFEESPELPNLAHTALATLARVKGGDGFMALSMNIDGLSLRAGHPREQLLELHGSLFDLKCTKCGYFEIDNFNTNLLGHSPEGDIKPALPKCPQCSNRALRPAVVWFGEPLTARITDRVDEYIKSAPIDLMLVIGTFAQVWPAAGYVDDAIEQGARVAMVNLDRGNLVPEGGALGPTHQDWFFVSDSAELVPKLLASLLDDEATDKVKT